jgi:putative transposase
VKKDITNAPADVADERLFDNWFDPIEMELRTKMRGFIEAMIEEELETALGRPRYGRRCGPPVEDEGAAVAGHRHGRRTRSLTGTFGRTEIAIPRARIFSADGKTTEWNSKVVLAYQRRTRVADALIASAYLSGTNTRRVRRALAALFRGAVGKDTVSRVWRKVKGDWDAWNARSLAEEPIIRLILDGTVVRVRLDRKSTSISLLIALGVRQDGQKVLLAVKSMGGESEAAWRILLDDLVKRGLRTPELVIADGAPGLEKALAALWPAVLVQRCTVHKHRNLLAHAPDRLHEELSADYKDMIYAATKQEVEAKRKAFLRKWRLKCPAVAASLEEAGDKLFTFTRFPKNQWKSLRTSNAIERLHEEFKRRIKTQTVLPSAETAAMLFWALLASGQITMRKVDGWQSLSEKASDRRLTSPHDQLTSPCWRSRQNQFQPKSRRHLRQPVKLLHHGLGQKRENDLNNLLGIKEFSVCSQIRL